MKNWFLVLLILLLASCQGERDNLAPPNNKPKQDSLVTKTNIILTPVVLQKFPEPEKKNRILTCQELVIPHKAGLRESDNMVLADTITPLTTYYLKFDNTFFKHFNSDQKLAQAWIDEHVLLRIKQLAQDGINATFRTDIDISSDIYSNCTTLNQMLDTFGVAMSILKPKADLYQLVQMRLQLGGLSWIDGLCETDLKYRCSVCYVYGDLSGNYIKLADGTRRNWEVQSTTHEQQGHGGGSQHTHDCVWNDNNTKIDDAPAYLGWTVDSCKPAPPIPIHGTIMGYWYLVNAIGVDLNLGFGNLPKARVKQHIFAADPCLSYHNACNQQIQGNITVTRTLTDTASVPLGYMFNDIVVTANGTGGGAPFTYLMVTDDGSKWVDKSVHIGHYEMIDKNKKVVYNRPMTFSVMISSADKCFLPVVVTVKP